MDGLGLPQSQYPRTLERKKFKNFPDMSAMLENTHHSLQVNNTYFKLYIIQISVKILHRETGVVLVW